MKNIKLGLLVMAAFSISSLSHAQLGGALKKAAKAATSKEAGKVVPGVGSGASSKVKMDWTMFPQTPAITMETLLSGTEVYNHGNLRANFYTGTFVPSKTASGQSVEPLFKNEGVLRTKLFVNDKLLKEVSYNDGDYFTEGKQVRFQTGSINNSDTDLTQEGKYRLEFYAGDKMFYKFDFEVAKKTDTDPYASESSLWYAKGPWEKYAYVTPQTTGNFIFGFYMMHTEFKPNPNDPRSSIKKVDWYPELYKDGKLISVKNKQTANLEKGEWKPFQSSIKLIGAKDFLKIAELADGNYSYKVTVDGEATPRNYKFSMKGGKIVQSTSQDRTKNTDPATLVEGWNNYFWLERS
ncbi:MAG TPA: hypothetical protein VF676_05625 [Flavobacterium sp.]|jgi:hypothetical protein